MAAVKQQQQEEEEETEELIGKTFNHMSNEECAQKNAVNNIKAVEDLQYLVAFGT